MFVEVLQYRIEAIVALDKRLSKPNLREYLLFTCLFVYLLFTVSLVFCLCRARTQVVVTTFWFL